MIVTVTALGLGLGLGLGVASPARAEEPAPGSIERSWFPLRPGERASATMGPSTIDALHAFEDKFGLVRTNDLPKRQWDAIARLAPRPGVLPAACTAAARRATTICVDMRQRLVRLVRDGEVALTMDARFGIAGQETRPGSFRVTSKSRDHVSTLYGTAMPYALFFDGDRAVHYSAFFARDGYAGASHGCVNVRDRAKARSLFDAVRVGTPVIVTG